MIEYLLDSGIQVFVVSWRNPTAEQRDWGLDTYVNALVEVSDAGKCDYRQREPERRGLPAPAVITASVLLGHLAAKQDRRINAATLLVTVLDPSD